jgi:hypothetical protein
VQKSVRSNKEDHCILIKGTIQQEEMTSLNICDPNIIAPTFIKQTLLSLRDQIGPDAIVVGDLNTPLSSIDGPSRQKVKKNIPKLSNTLNKMDFQTIIEHFIQHQQIIHSYQQPMEHFLK